MGMVYIIGAGPGDPDLITVKGLKRLRESDIVLYDRLISREILKYVKPSSKLIYVGKEPGKHEYAQNEVISMMIEYAKQGYRVARLHGGDPFLFGRGFEEILELRKAAINYEVIPGVSSIYAVPEYFEIPLVHRGIASSFAVLTGMEDPRKGRKFVDFRKVAKSVDTIVIVMGAKNVKNIAQELVEGGLDPSTPVAILRAYLESELKIITTLGDILSSDINVKSPVIIVIGNVVKLARD